MKMSDPQIPRELVERARAAERVVVFTGAGISAESGLPTFREAQTGLWARYDPMELATPQAFQRNPQLVWQWYAWRRELATKSEPNPGHVSIARLAQLVPQLVLITQNIDGLHQRAGSQDPIELHGNIHRVKCFRCEHQPADWDRAAESPPPCTVCGGLLRPDVVWFGEALPDNALAQAIGQAQSADLFITVGTSGLVHPAASIPLLAERAGALMVEVNPVTTELSRIMDYRLSGQAGKVMPAFLEAIRADLPPFAGDQA